MNRLVPLLALLAMAACRPPIYDIDRMDDPLKKARFSCQYLLERELATDEQKDPDGVLRRRIADFAEPSVVNNAGKVTTTWPEGSIVLRGDGSRHHGGCVMTLREFGRFVDAVTLDGKPVHAGFGM